MVCWTFSVANKSGHFSFGSFCVISFTTQGFLWFLGNQCSRARVVQCWRLRGFSVQRIYYANRSSNRFLSAASAVLLLPSCVQPLTLHSETFCVTKSKRISRAAFHLVPNTFSPRTFPSQLVPKNKQSRLIWSPWTNGPQVNWSPWTIGPQNIISIFSNFFTSGG